VIGIVLLVSCLAPLGVLRGFLSNDTKWSRHQQDMARLTAPLAPPRQDLTGEQPTVARRIPGQALAAEGFVDIPAPAYQRPPAAALERVLAGLRGLDSERVNNEYRGRHRDDDPRVVGCSTQKAGRRALRIPTAEWELLVAPLTADWCESCRGVVADGESPHLFCPGCACPCRHPEMLIGRPPQMAGAL
jgi:hypothetical protein